MEENNYISVSQFAQLHSMDPGNIRRIIAQGRIPAIKIGNQWAIKSDTQPPADKRIKNGKYINARKSKQTSPE